MAYTFDAQIVSDLHKDAYGCRPSAFWWQCWNEASDDVKQEEWDILLAALKRSIDDEEEEKRLALEQFEKELAQIRVMSPHGLHLSEAEAIAYMTPVEFEDNPDLTRQDVEHWLWQRGILFTDRGRSLVETIYAIHKVEEDYEDDGQPSEMQEWHDFDPDC